MLRFGIAYIRCFFWGRRPIRVDDGPSLLSPHCNFNRSPINLFFSHVHSFPAASRTPVCVGPLCDVVGRMRRRVRMFHPESPKEAVTVWC